METTTCGRCFPLDRCYCRTAAADLPGGSVVALPWIAWIKGTYGWNVTGGGAKELDYNRPDSDVDEALSNGAQVLRVGTGRKAHQ